MNEDVRMPIETVRDGEKITKTCVEDVYKIINRVEDQLLKSYNNSIDILESVHKKYWPDGEDNTYYEGELIVGTGTSQPCNGDIFDEKTGNEIAFQKMKLNVNLKKYNLLRRVYNEYVVESDTDTITPEVLRKICDEQGEDLTDEEIQIIMDNVGNGNEINFDDFYTVMTKTAYS